MLYFELYIHLSNVYQAFFSGGISLQVLRHSSTQSIKMFLFSGILQQTIITEKLKRPLMGVKFQEKF